MQHAIRVAALFCLLASISPANAQFLNPTTAKTGPYKSAGSGQYAVSIDSATSLTVPAGAYVAEICVEGQAARYKDDGGTPTTSSGIPVAAGTCFQYAGRLASFQIIGQTSGATLDVSYYQ